MGERIGIGAAVTVAAAAGAWLAVSSCSIDPTVKEPYKERDLQAKEIRAMLTSGDFMKQREASRQIEKLEPEERLRILTTLSKDADAPVRLIAVKNLHKIDDPRAKETLAKLAKDDPDETVRELAGGK